MEGYEVLRRQMVERQLQPRGISEPRVLEVMRTVPRHVFVPEDIRHRAYDDMALPLAHGQTISQPYMVGVMTELLELAGTERVLEIGTGSGYQCAVLSRLCAKVYSIERICELTEYATEKLKSLGYDNVHLKCSDGTLGWPDEAPFDRIIVTAAAPELPAPLVEQLAEGGIIMAPLGSHYSQILTIGRKEGGVLKLSHHTGCVFVPLLGAHAWPEDR